MARSVVALNNSRKIDNTHYYVGDKKRNRITCSNCGE